jgi:peptide/nickel transport system permease protein
MTRARDSLVATLSRRQSTRSAQRATLRFARANPLGTFGALLILVLVLVGVFAPLLAPHEINAFAGRPGLGPTADFPFGTDKFGQDIFSRVINGARISLQVGFLAVITGTLLGLGVGVTPATRAGWWTRSSSASSTR